jgi:hypothetical protein
MTDVRGLSLDMLVPLGAVRLPLAVLLMAVLV